MSLSQRIVNWARGRLGQTVGLGECWDLAEQALRQAGARTSTDLGPVEADSDYIWGTQLNDISDVRVGDILQLRDHVTTTTTVIVYTFADGTTDTVTDEVELERPHHTAIVTALPNADGVLRTLEQNVQPGGRVVQTQRLATRDIPAVVRNSTGRQPHPRTGRVERVTVRTTVTVTVSDTATIWYYRPRPR